MGQIHSKDATKWADITGSSLHVVQRTLGRSLAFEDMSFVSGDNPVTHDVNAGMGRNGQDGYFSCDGPGSLAVLFSDDGTTYGGSHTLLKGDIMNLQGLDIDTIRVIWFADSAYRINVI